ncbi:hypothetical protein HS088_TW04G01062 [Tripterygium wilfordii]|uniref:Uncharacterized protein n=1 Tax=Tripterygium wilfordii TaxID=458696 RepID=A0A7J7DRV5_TRIWF|nr:hypothetical protein HS088_TW04G01062 [Tripterygium wilfordii]
MSTDEGIHVAEKLCATASPDHQVIPSFQRLAQTRKRSFFLGVTIKGRFYGKISGQEARTSSTLRNYADLKRRKVGFLSEKVRCVLLFDESDAPEQFAKRLSIFYD